MVKQIKRSLPVVLSLALLGVAVTNMPAFAGESCTCRYKGQDVPEGQSICMSSSSGSRMARCERVLNNTSWKMLNDPCPQAQYQVPTHPADESQKPVTAKRKS